ncbi:hypothetical protein [Bombella apis]|uniref:hypothetical protein n=1 Tax=Bombella apis TaxID=1785988 RepID=UPI0012B82E04|nr:hypothetical protein [Bombella apis]MPW00457.1 hypothetical protein [Bombella apis]
MRFTLALLASLMAGTAFADSIAVPPAQHGIFDGGQLPTAAQGIMTFGAAGGVSLTARPYSALPLSVPVGTAFFCTDCAGTGQPVFFNGSAWVDASGTGAKHP